MPHFVHTPGKSAPATGTYEEVNISYRPTGRTVHADVGESLPTSGYGYILIR
jgi:hypothetical protein